MKVGDLVMWMDECSTYAKWFFGQMAFVESVSYAKDGKLHCRVRWMQPIPYFDRFATVSDFGAERFQVMESKDGSN
tara:strand:+ start:368 stop:595 length:228 start_codon:yes stop_codon:yes gene_type:complete